ncbi:MAG: hypothetical protein U9N11_04545, partial [Campylobacterota bacterium]|nr:hypothetical protein [Campylobacterota bacterium]
MEKKSLFAYVLQMLFVLMLVSFSPSYLGAIDTDGDGIEDSIDLDDDNDGIADVLECPIQSKAVYADWSDWQLNDTALVVPHYLGGDISVNLVRSYKKDGADVSYVHLTGAYSQAVLPSDQATQAWGGSNFPAEYPDGYLENNTSTLIMRPNGADGAGTFLHEVEFDYTTTTLGTTKENDFIGFAGIYGDGYAGYDAQVRIYAYKADGTLETDYSNWTIVKSDVDTSSNDGAPFTSPVSISNDSNGILVDANIATSDSDSRHVQIHPSSTPYSKIILERQVITTVKDVEHWALTSGYRLVDCPDTDNDGIFDYLDTDSDNDSCPDALEGDGGYTYADLNFNEALSTVPATTQSVGSSIDENTTAVECDSCDSNSSLFVDTDGDTIANDCDNDDDNDGIADVLECPIQSKAVYADWSDWQLDDTALVVPHHLGGDISVNLVKSYTKDGADVSYVHLTGAYSQAVLPSDQATQAWGGSNFPAEYPDGYLDNNTSTVIMRANGADGVGTFLHEVEFDYTTTTLKTTNENDFIGFAGIYGDSGDYDTKMRIYAYKADGTLETDYSNWTVVKSDVDTSSNDGASFKSTVTISNDSTGIVVDPKMATSNTGSHYVQLHPSSTPYSKIILERELIATGQQENDHWALTSGYRLIDCPDTDGDGVADYLDLDSDNDSCPDALEGDGGYTYDDIDSNGALNTAPATTQSVGSSIDENTTAVECDSCDSNSSLFVDTDGDTIANDCDNDDDNDGILDTDEGRYGSMLDFNTLEASTATPGNPVALTTTIDDLQVNINISADIGSTAISPDNEGTFYTRDSSGGNGSGIIFYPNGISSTSDASEATIAFSETIDNLQFLVTDVDGGNGLSDETFEIVASYEGVPYILSASDITAVSGVQPTLSNNVLDGTGAGGSNVFLVTINSPIDRIYFRHSIDQDLINSSNVVVVFDLSFDRFKDTDGDGIRDHLDLDSDDDTCPDANEAYKSLTAIGTDGDEYGLDTATEGSGVDSTGSVDTASYATPDVITDGNNTFQQATTVAITAALSNSISYKSEAFTFDGTSTVTVGSTDPNTTANTTTLYQWYLSEDNGTTFTEISGETGAKLVFSSLTTAQDGNIYKVHAYNEANFCGVESEAKLTVYDPQMLVIKTASYADTDGDGMASVDDVITYTFTVKNTGNVTLTDI